LGTILYDTAGDYSIKVWIDNLNGLTDANTADDTVSTTGYVCSSPFNGTYEIGQNNADFKTIEEFVDKLSFCGANGDIILEMQPGTYTQKIILYNLTPLLSGYSLTLTSTTHHAEEVIIKQNVSGTGITLTLCKNIIIKDITVDVTQGGYGIQMNANCTNIVIRDCRLLANPTGTSGYLIYSLQMALDSIFIIHNFIDGGHTGVYIYGPTVGNKNFIIDSNTIQNSYEYGMRLRYNNYISVSHNTILSRSSNVISTIYWYGIFKGDGGYVKKMEGNSIRQLNPLITNASIYGISFNSQRSDTSLVANNEIILINGGTGMYLVGSIGRFLHNSIYIGGTASSRGISVTSEGYHITIKKNNIIMASSSSYPIYLDGTFNSLQRDIDYNNMYAPTNVGYAGGAKTSITAWQQTVTTDQHSIKVHPGFINSAVNLQLQSYVDMACPKEPIIDFDINDEPRLSTTSIGCYHAPYIVNAKLANISGNREGILLGVTDSIKVMLMNTGTTALTKATIKWEWNDTLQPDVLWTGSLMLGDTAIVSLGKVLYDTAGTYNIKAWIDNLDLLTDEYPTDDTATISGYICNNTLSGVYQLGANNADFVSIADFMRKLSICGASGNITVEMQTGTYQGEIDLSNIADLLGGYSFTLTSVEHDRSKVIITTTLYDRAGIILSNSNNIIIKDVTVNTRLFSGHYPILFTSACTNVVIRDCDLLAYIGTSSPYSPIGKVAGTGIVDSIFIINNLLDGGYAGVYLYGGTGNTAYATHVVIDSNTISNVYYYGIYTYNTDFTSISHNHISSRASSTGAAWYGISSAYCNGNIIANHIFQQNTAITSPYGIMSLYFNYYNTTDTGLIANNEIIMNTTTTRAGIYANSYTHAKIIHNSINVTGSGAAYGIQIVNNVNNYVEIKNNNIVMQSSAAYPIYLNSIANLNLYNMDYNNMVAPTYAGYAAANIATIDDWQQIVTTDKHSVNRPPLFVDSTVSLELSNYSGLLCPLYPNINSDINDNRRLSTSVMGAYTAMKTDYNLSLQDINSMGNEVVENQNVPVSVQVVSMGNVKDIDSATFKWSLNGIIQPQSYKWVPASPLQLGQMAEVFIDNFSVNGFGNVEVSVWAETINGGKDSLFWDDTVTKVANIVPLARFVSPLVADTTNALSFNIHVKIIEESGALTLTPTPQMNIRTQMSGETVLYDTIDMVYDNSTGLWIAHIPKQYYGSTVTYSITVSDTVGNNITIEDQTYLKFVSGSELYSNSHLAITALQGLVELGTSCIPDYVTATVILSNTGTEDYDFVANPVKLYIQVTQPEPFYLDTVLSSDDVLFSGDEMFVDLTNMFPTVVAGQYDIRIWIDSISPVVYDDTLALDYVSGKFGLPVDEEFSNGIPIVFASRGLNSYNRWEVIPQGTGADTAVLPVFGAGMLAFGGSPGSMTSLSTQQLDLSRTVQPSLSFWYFHDTVPCEDYTDVRITTDGGMTYETLLSLTKYDPVYGWKQYDKELPLYAVNQCVILTFEAMEKSRSGNVFQYIDRIRITARQDIAVAEILISPFSICDLENKEIKVVMSNLSDLALNYIAMPTTLTLEVKETGQTFDTLLTSGSLGSFASDTITIATGFNFAEGNYTLKAYFSSVLDVDRNNDTLETSIVINPALSVQLEQISDGNTNCLSGDNVIYPKVTLYNTGNMDLSNIELTIQIDTGENNLATYATITEIYTGNILAGDSATYIFTNAYSVPWNIRYYVRVTGNLACDPLLAYSTVMVTECVDIRDLRLISIDNPSTGKDSIANPMQVIVTLINTDDMDDFNNTDITVMITNSQDVQTETFTETIPMVNHLTSSTSYTFTNTYTVPNDSVYYLTVYINSYDRYSFNDTLIARREAVKKPIDSTAIKGIDEIMGFALGQIIPNPAINSTRIDYSIPETGEVIFHIQSVSGQLLYSQTIEAASGKNSLEFNTNTLAAGIYIYSIEYKGQRLIKRMSVQK
jgi:hypothetical protein